jgi:hypothetical protein
MSNMSYCRFENTARDLRDCREQLELLFQGDAEGLTKISKNNREEREARVELMELCEQIAEMMEEKRRLTRKEGATAEDLVNIAEAELAEEEEGDDE